MYILFGFMMVFLLSNVLALLNVMVIGFLNQIIKKINLKIILIPLSLTLVAIIKEFLLGGFPWNPSSVIWVNNLYILKILYIYIINNVITSFVPGTCITHASLSVSTFLEGVYDVSTMTHVPVNKCVMM